MGKIDLPIVTTSARSAFRRCPQLWYWKYVDGLQRRGEVPDALWFGIGVHIALADWYMPGKRRGPHPAETFVEWHGEEERWLRAAYADHDRAQGQVEQAKYENALDLGVAMLEGYVDEYGKDPSWDVIAIEHPFKIKVLSHGRAIAYFMSTWDGVIRDLADGRIYLIEHKTATSIQTSYLELDDQAGIYWAVASAILRQKGILGPKEEIAGIIYNFLRKSMGDDRPQDRQGNYLNKNGSISKRQPPPRYVREIVERSAKERKTQMYRLADEVSWMNAILDGDKPVIKNTTKDCTFCEFFTMCKSHERGGEAWKEIAKVDFKVEEPFDRYLKSA